MSFLHLFIVNKSGGLIHHRPLSAEAPKIGTNEYLRIASTFHSLHAIAAEASPIRCVNGKNVCECDLVLSLSVSLMYSCLY
jgi:trafficking protein particle complex subunit 4